MCNELLLSFKNFKETITTTQKVLVVSTEKSEKNFFLQTIQRDYPLAFFVSFERAASIIEEERKNDDGDYIEGGIDIGRTALTFLLETTHKTKEEIVNHPIVSLINIKSFFARGLKYLSTGEMRKLLLCSALIQKAFPIVVDDVFEGLDKETRNSLSVYFETENECLVLFFASRYSSYSFISHVIQEKEGNLCLFPKSDYEKNYLDKKSSVTYRQDLLLELVGHTENGGENKPLVSMHNVTVSWGEKKVLQNLTWHVNSFEHWLIRGPNGSGKTTLLELITGDNMQVFSNDVWLFGKKRGSGETIWDIKAKLGIVSQKMHTEYRLVKGLTVQQVIISGFRDTIGLYESVTRSETLLAEKWLELFALKDKQNENFQHLSYGEQRYVLIIRALVKIPPLLILDEPCHNLSDSERKLVLTLIEKIAAMNITTILHVTHDTEEIMAFEKNILELCPNKDPMYSIYKTV